MVKSNTKSLGAPHICRHGSRQRTLLPSRSQNMKGISQPRRKKESVRLPERSRYKIPQPMRLGQGLRVKMSLKRPPDNVL